MSDCASIARGGQDEVADRAQLRALALGAGEHHGWAPSSRASARSRSRTDGEQVVLEAVIQRDVRWRAHRDDRFGAVEPQLVEHLFARLEVGEVVLLLEAFIRAQLPLRAVADEALGGDRVGHDDRRREPAVDVVLRRCPLVVEHRRAGDPKRRSSDGDVVRAVAERDVEARAGSPVRRGPSRQGDRPRREADRLGQSRPPPR